MKMKVEVYGIAKCTIKGCGITEGKEYAIIKVTYQKFFPEGLVTYIDDDGELKRKTSYLFKYKTK